MKKRLNIGHRIKALTIRTQVPFWLLYLPAQITGPRWLAGTLSLAALAYPCSDKHYRKGWPLALRQCFFAAMGLANWMIYLYR